MAAPVINTPKMCSWAYSWAAFRHLGEVCDPSSSSSPTSLVGESYGETGATSTGCRTD